MRRHLVILVATAVVALTLPAGAFAACSGIDVQPTVENLDQVSATTLCLINQQRTDNGLPALSQQSELDLASVDYSELMVDQQFFAHVSPAGSVLTQRLTDSGYLGGTGAWIVGENIAWGESYLATPGAIVTAWMNSPGHRANILSRDYDEIGVGIAIGVPTSNNSGATYTTDFGHRDDDSGDDQGDAPADGTGGSNALDPAPATQPAAKRHTTGGRATSGTTKPARPATVKARSTCKPVMHRGAARQSLRGRCIVGARRRARHR